MSYLIYTTPYLVQVIDDSSGSLVSEQGHESLTMGNLYLSCKAICNGTRYVIVFNSDHLFRFRVTGNSRRVNAFYILNRANQGVINDTIKKYNAKKPLRIIIHKEYRKNISSTI